MQQDESGWFIQSDKAISGVAPGQFGVLYHPENPYCLGSGIISER